VDDSYCGLHHEIEKKNKKNKKTLDRLSSETRHQLTWNSFQLFFSTNFYHFVRKKGPTTSTNDFFGKK
jgi:hypothetical protein